MKTGEAEEVDVLDSEKETDLEDDQPQDGANKGEEGGQVDNDAGDGEGGDREEEETVVSIGSEEPPTSETGEGESTVFADLRKRLRETSRELRKAQEQLASGQQVVQPKVPQLRAKPTLEGHEFDAEAFQTDLDKWYAEKAEADRKTAEAQAAQRQAVEAQQRAVQVVQANYAKSKEALKVKDFQQAEDEVAAQFSEVQQSIVASGAANPGLVVYALGKNPKKLAELASIKDPVKFAVAIGKLETEVKVTKRTSTKPAPERTMTGGGSGSTSKATLERLQAEADKTGDRSKVARFIRQQRLAGQK